MPQNVFIALSLAIACNFHPPFMVSSLSVSSNQSVDVTLSQLETKFFEHQYDTDDDTTRMNHIEQFIFGCNQIGPMSSRLQHVLSAIPDTTTNKIVNAPSPNSDSDNSTNNDNTSNQSSNSQQNNELADNPASDNSHYSSYPRVTTLEQEILGHTYESDSITRRLGRLETKAYGSISSNNDLGQRVDNLDDYAQRHDLYGDRKIANNTNSSLTFVSSRNQKPNNSVYPKNIPTETSVPIDSQPTYTSNSGSFVGSIEERVAMMEAQEYDHTYPEKPLDKRLKKLEKKVLPNQDNSQLGLFERTSKLWITLHPSDKNMNNLIADNNTGVANSFTPNSTPTNTVSAATAATATPATAKHGSWLHKFANQIESATTNQYSGYSNFSGSNTGTPGYAYPGSFYVPQTSNSARSVFVGGSFGPGAGPGGLPIGFW